MFQLFNNLIVADQWRAIH